MIRIENLCFSYGEKPVLRDLTLTIPLEGITVICGPSGCGKTTLLRILAGLEKARSGTLSGISPADTAFLFQENRLLPWRTVLQHITDVQPRKDRKKALQWLKLTELDQEADSYPAALSGGMCRRLALARCLALEGRAVLLDEPFAGIDPERTRRILDRLRGLSVPVILVAHEENLTVLADRVIRLESPAP